MRPESSFSTREASGEPVKNDMKIQLGEMQIPDGTNNIENQIYLIDLQQILEIKMLEVCKSNINKEESN